MSKLEPFVFDEACCCCLGESYRGFLDADDGRPLAEISGADEDGGGGVERTDEDELARAASPPPPPLTDDEPLLVLDITFSFQCLSE